VPIGKQLESLIAYEDTCKDISEDIRLLEILEEEGNDDDDRSDECELSK
jgi:hypothetical protein